MLQRDEAATACAVGNAGCYFAVSVVPTERACTSHYAARRHRQLLALELIDVRQHFGHGGVRFGRNRLADVDFFVEQLRQRLALDDRNVVLQRQPANPLREHARALGHDDRRRHLLRIVLNRHGQLGRIRDDHVGLRHAARNAVEHHLPLNRPGGGRRSADRPAGSSFPRGLPGASSAGPARASSAATP